jgi:hypothetical protein
MQQYQVAAETPLLLMQQAQVAIQQVNNEKTLSFAPFFFFM